MKFEICILLLTITGAIAGTNVNISFTQQHSRAGLKVTELQNDQVQLKTTDSLNQYKDDNGSRFARIQVTDKKSENEDGENRKTASSEATNHDSTADYRSERVQSGEKEGFFGTRAHNQQRTFYSSNREVQQSHGQFRNLSPQDKQNMEFERYIQSYHSGPTVETVFESAKPEMQHPLVSSSVPERSQRVVKFERQVALPTKADSVQSSIDSAKPIVNHQSSLSPSSTISLSSTPSSASSSAASLLPSIPSISVSSSSGNNVKVNLNQNPSAGKEGFNFDLNYNKPNYNDPSLKYNDEHSDSHFYNQFPPSVEEPHNGYGDYYSNNYNRHQVMDGYQPAESRPIVTKTIQIAQPAIKAKKYEVRHPAIQKEFYDIEERVVIKPAGTVVVELERPSAKILKEETTLPLGHPHPAVAGAYMQNRNTQTFSNIIYSNSGTSSSNHLNNQYIPHQTFNNKNLVDHHSSVTTSSNYDQTKKDLASESNQNKPFIGENQYSSSSSTDALKPQREIVVLTDGHGNQRQLSTDKFTYSREDTNKAPSRSVYNPHRSSFAYEDSSRSNGQVITAPQRSGFQANHDNREDFSFDAEYISTAGNNNLRKENKPARLQEASSERLVEQTKQQPQPIIKHEHKIVLSPSQHNIYLSRNQEVPKTKFIEETAEVREINPYLQNHRGSVVVYAPAKKTVESTFVQRMDYNKPARVLSQGTEYRSNQQRGLSGGNDNRVQYSAPYAQMRHHSVENQSQNEQLHQTDESRRQTKFEKLILEDKSMADDQKSSKETSIEKEKPSAHIEIKIPDSSSDDGNKAIFVSSTIRPMMMDDSREGSQNSKLEISVTNNGEPKKEKRLDDEYDANDQINTEGKSLSEKDTEQFSDIKTNPDCDKNSKSASSENYELDPESNHSRQSKFMRIVEGSGSSSSSSKAVTTADTNAVQSNVQPHNVDVNVKSAAGHLSPAGSRVIASTAAPKESSPSESFHKRRIVVNHPFQTVREVVEHEPYTNYHEVQVHEPATPALYHSANYYQPLGALRQAESRNSPAYYS